MNDLEECRVATVRALDLDADEVMSLSTASALLDAHQVAAPSDDLGALRQWLIYCGLNCEGGQISLTRSRAHLIENAYVSGGVCELVEQLSALLLVNRNGKKTVTLGDLLDGAEAADEEFGVVSRMLRDATFTPSEGWVVPDRSTDAQRRRATGSGGSSAELKTTGSSDPWRATEEVKNSEAGSDGTIPSTGALADAGEVGLASPGDLIAQLLNGCTEGMSTSRIEDALDGVVPEGVVTETLFTDARFAITATGAWRLHVGFDRTAPSVAAIPDRGRSPREEAFTSATKPVGRVGSRGGLQRERERLDKVEAALRRAETPLTAEELKQRTGVTIGIQYLRQQIEGDARFSRCQRNQWALAEWRLPVYKPIKELISDMVDAHGGQVETDKIVTFLRRDFEVKESSLRAAMSSAPFTTRGGIVRRIGEDLDSGSGESHVPASRTAAETKALTDQQPRPVDKSPDVDELMDHLGLI